MGLFDFLGVDSPMFIPTRGGNPRLDIDYGSLMPALPKQQQAPSIAANDYSKLKWTEGDLREQQQKEQLAQKYISDAYMQSGGNLNSIPNNPNFKKAQQLYSLNPEEVAIKNQYKEFYDKKVTEFKDKGGQLDVDYFNRTGQMRTIAQSLDAFNMTPSSMQQGPEWEATQRMIKSDNPVGTQTDLDKDIDGALEKATGKTVKEMNDLSTRGIVNGKQAGVIEGTEGIYETIVKGSTNEQQLADTATRIVHNLTPEAQYAMQADFVRDTNGQIPVDTSVIKDPQQRKMAEKAYAQYVVDKVREYIRPKVSTEESSVSKYHKLFDEYERAKTRKATALMSKELETGPWTRAYTRQEEPSNVINKQTVLFKDKDGNVKEKSVDVKTGQWGGLAFNYDSKKGEKMPAEQLGNNILFAGKENNPDILKGSYVTNINTPTQVVDKSRQAYYPDEKDPNRELSSEEFDDIQKAGALQYKTVVNATAFVPMKQFDRVGRELKGYVRDGDQLSETNAYDHHWFGKNLNENLEGEGSLKPTKRINPATGEEEEGVEISFQTTPTPESLKWLDRVTHEQEKEKVYALPESSIINE